MLKASTAPLVVLTGGPGCGKTFATKAIVQLWGQQQKDIRLAAPTGAAFLPQTLHAFISMLPLQMQFLVFKMIMVNMR